MGDFREPSFRFNHAAFEPTCLSSPRDDEHRRFNFDLCRAIDMTSLDIVLRKMVAAGAMDVRMAELFHSQASTLLALLRSENNRLLADTNKEPPK